MSRWDQVWDPSVCDLGMVVRRWSLARWGKGELTVSRGSGARPLGRRYIRSCSPYGSAWGLGHFSVVSAWLTLKKKVPLPPFRALWISYS